MPSVLHRRTYAAGVLVLALAGVAGCGGSSSGGGTQSVKVNTKAAALVPAAIKSKGSVVVAADATYAPNEFIKPGTSTVVGMDADLAKAIFGALNLKVTITNETFDGIIPGIQDGKYDVGMSSFTDEKSREKVVDFVDYFKAGTSFYENASGGPPVTGLSSLCGLKVSVEKGTTEQTDAMKQSKKCTSAGKSAVTVDTYNDQNGANLAISSGHDQIGMADSPVASYQVKQSNGQFKLVGTPYGVAPYGIALPKGSGLVPAVQKALQGLIDDGTYAQILDKWGVQAGAIKTATVNGAIF
jgi:polar amino acid transport system substrate-binding protein